MGLPTVSLVALRARATVLYRHRAYRIRDPNAYWCSLRCQGDWMFQGLVNLDDGLFAFRESSLVFECTEELVDGMACTTVCRSSRVQAETSSVVCALLAMPVCSYVFGKGSGLRKFLVFLHVFSCQFRRRRRGTSRQQDGRRSCSL